MGEFKHITTDLAFALQVERLEARVIEPLKSYGAIVKRKRVSGRRSCTYDEQAARSNTLLLNPPDRHLRHKEDAYHQISVFHFHLN